MNQKFLHGLITTLISTFATALLGYNINPTTFNFSDTKGIEHMLASAGLTSLLAVLALFKQPPQS